MSSIVSRRDVAAPGSTMEHGPSARPAQELRRRFLGALAPAMVVGALGAVAFWGHSTDWELPVLSIGGTPSQDADWCAAHNVPESSCIECNTALLPREKDYGWCKEHGIAQCPLHHPEIGQLNTAIAPAVDDIRRASQALALMPRSENNSHCKLHQKRIQFASAEAVDKAGIDIAVVQQRPMIEAVIANGELIYDQSHTAKLASRVGGTAWRVEKRVGDPVRKGEILTLVDAAEIGRAKSEFLQALTQARLRQATVDRLRPLVNGGGVAGKQLLEADTALQEAEIRQQTARQSLVNLGLLIHLNEYANLSLDQINQRIHFLGLPPETARQFDTNVTTSNLFPLCSPLDGVVVERNIVAGEVVDASTSLFTVSDISRIWLMLDVKQEDAKYVSLGQAVRFRPGGSASEGDVKGAIDWISTPADAHTRTVKARAELSNADGRLKANTFGAGRIVIRDEPKAIAVPTEAIHWDGCCSVVFVRDKDYLNPEAPKFFHIRKIRPGAKDGDATEVIAGLLPGEVIASKNSVILEAQLLKTNLGAGCGCADGH